MRSIVIATDGSDSAEQAFAFAVDLAQTTGAALHVVAVRPPLVPSRCAAPPVLEIEGHHGAERIASTAASRARELGVETYVHVTSGEPAPTIAALAEDLGGDLLVVGSRGLGAFSGALLGSVSRALVRRSRVPVTVVKASPVREPVAA